MSVRDLNYELPYSDWLYKLVMSRLIPLWFTVMHQHSGKLLAIANEYILSKSDLTIYHAVKCEIHIQALYVAMNTDVLQSPYHYEVQEVDLVQCVAELKVKESTTSTENECFYNMFSERIKLVLKKL